MGSLDRRRGLHGATGSTSLGEAVNWDGEERRHMTQITDEQMEALAEKAAEKALQKVYAAVGHSIVTKIFWFIGACAIATLLWMGGKGIKP
jgi:hypothetical protein